MPVLTLSGKSFVSRVAASLLNAVDLPELITDCQSVFESTAIELALNRSNLKELRKRLDIKRKTSSLFKGDEFAFHLEMAFKAVYQRLKDGELPDNYEVDLAP